MTDKQIIGGRGSAKPYTTLNTVEVLLELEHVKAENILLREENAIHIRDWEDKKNENYELARKNEELQEKVNNLTILGMDLNQNNEVLRKSFLTADRNKDNWREQAEKYYKTLTKIKEFVEHFCGKHCPNCDDEECEMCIEDCILDEIVNPVLQKISEVIG